MTDLSDLEAKARAATPGPWEANEDGVATRVNGRYRVVLSTNIYDSRRANDAAFVAACSPEVILRLCEVVKAAKAVGFSNGFDAAYPDKLAALRSALKGMDASPPPPTGEPRNEQEDRRG